MLIHIEVIETIANKLLGIIIIDSNLHFEDHNLRLCHEASIKLNALIAFEMYCKKNVNYDFFGLNFICCYPRFEVGHL